MNDITYIKSRLSEADLLCQLAEEAAELAQAALKLRRVLDGTNPTPVTEDAALASLCEEIADVNVALDVCFGKLGLNWEDDVANIEEKKIVRWAARLREASR